MKPKAKYVTEGQCPFCDSSNLVWDQPEIKLPNIVHTVCTDCDESFMMEIYISFGGYSSNPVDANAWMLLPPTWWDKLKERLYKLCTFK